MSFILYYISYIIIDKYTCEFSFNSLDFIILEELLHFSQ